MAGLDEEEDDKEQDPLAMYSAEKLAQLQNPVSSTGKRKDLTELGARYGRRNRERRGRRRRECR